MTRQPVAAMPRVDDVSVSLSRVRAAVDRFVRWLEGYGETSYDFQTCYVGAFGRRAKALYYRRPLVGTVAVSPMVLCEAVVPSARAIFGPRQRFPIADAHYAMGFAVLYRTFGDRTDYRRAVHFLEVLQATRCPGYPRHGWGYPFDWETRQGTIRAGTPLITTLPYVYEAFRDVHEIDGKPEWLCTMRSIAEHALVDYRDVETSRDGASCTYTPGADDPAGVINASAYRAFLLTRAARDFSEPKYAATAARNVEFVLESQNADGSWFYSIDGQRDFIDHFHTCFVLKALAKIEQLTGDPRCTAAIDRGLDYYIDHLFDTRGLPRSFSRAPRLTVYRRELYDYAECVNLGLLLRHRRSRLDPIVAGAVRDVLERWQRPDGSFRTRQLFWGWDTVPMHRWGQSQMFRALCLLLRQA